MTIAKFALSTSTAVFVALTWMFVRTDGGNHLAIAVCACQAVLCGCGLYGFVRHEKTHKQHSPPEDQSNATG